MVGEIVEDVVYGVVLSADSRHSPTPTGSLGAVSGQTTVTVVGSTDRHQAQDARHVGLLPARLSVKFQTTGGI